RAHRGYARCLGPTLPARAGTGGSGTHERGGTSVVAQGRRRWSGPRRRRAGSECRHVRTSASAGARPGRRSEERRLKAVFDTKSGSRYDDDVSVKYHFPNAKYLRVAAACVGDWIVYREPRDGGGSLAYFAAARVMSIEPDPADHSHSYAVMSNY